MDGWIVGAPSRGSKHGGLKVVKSSSRRKGKAQGSIILKVVCTMYNCISKYMCQYYKSFSAGYYIKKKLEKKNDFFFFFKH